MGGNAFSSAGLNTPRMSPSVYTFVRNECQKKLSELYVCVATPIEGPAKKDYGDVDILVCLERRAVFPRDELDLTIPQPRFGQDILGQIGEQLGASRINYLPGNKSANYALPWPDHLLPAMDCTQPNGTTRPSENKKAPLHVQVDVQIDTTVDEMQWHLFKHAHGDIWHLIGVMIRPLGLTVDEEALWLRIPEIEWVNKKQAKVKLSSDPADVLRFLGFSGRGCTETNLKTTSNGVVKCVSSADANDDDSRLLYEAWSQPFATVQDLFWYLTTCHWFFQTTPVPVTAESAEGAAPLRSNDRRRLASRPLFARWINEFIPQLQEEGRFDDALPVAVVREHVRDAAFSRFPAVRETYHERLHAFLVQRQRDFIKKEVIKPSVPLDVDANKRGVVVSALKKIILEGDQTFGITPRDTLLNVDGLYESDRVKAWVEKNWEDVLESAWKINGQRATEAMRKRDLKRKMAETDNRE
ncbi:hypothetical protein DL546_003238 [Coniochaeta pulveracea]|uniref:Uncharacterized protein n=1 Tax=Coniochaeta pulveracea TaxID=177199 RepID=A0A420Y4J3_9PEZI|nr:hypothetical protein DL546_003238 [Coniochaeta pulveracea]